jgi:flagellar basal-body rod protein FlgC
MAQQFNNSCWFKFAGKDFENLVDGRTSIHFLSKREAIMFPGFATALSGIQAGGRILGVGAHNIANAQTENFKRTQATLEESSAGGVIVSLSQDQRPGPQFTTGEDPFTLREGSNVELEEELIHTLEATHLIEANLASIRAQDQVLGSLLDIMK